MRKVCDVTNEQFMVLVVEYSEADKTNIEKFVRSLSETSNANYGKVKCVYQGSDQKVISALENILDLTK